METQKCENFSKSSKLTQLNSVRTQNFRTPRKKKRPGFVNISPTLVIDTSTERSSRVLQHGNQKIMCTNASFEIISMDNFLRKLPSQPCVCSFAISYELISYLFCILLNFYYSFSKKIIDFFFVMCKSVANMMHWKSVYLCFN